MGLPLIVEAWESSRLRQVITTLGVSGNQRSPLSARSQSIESRESFLKFRGNRLESMRAVQIQLHRFAVHTRLYISSSLGRVIGYPPVKVNTFDLTTFDGFARSAAWLNNLILLT